MTTKTKLPEGLLKGLRDGSRNSQILMEAYAMGELYYDGYLWGIGPYTNKLAKELLDCGLLKGRPTLREARVEYTANKMRLLAAFDQCGGEVPMGELDYIPKREAELSRLEKMVKAAYGDDYFEEGFRP